jgi:hypothetical protein
MTENKNFEVGGIYSKFWRITLVIVSMLLIFAGPAYVPLMMVDLHINYVVSTAVGGMLFIVGIVFMLWLVQKKIITA